MESAEVGKDGVNGDLPTIILKHMTHIKLVMDFIYALVS